MRRRTGLLAAGTALVMTVGVTGAAVAAGGTSSPGAKDKGTTVGPVKPGKDKGDSRTLETIAKRYGVTVTQLDTALRHVKKRLGANGGNLKDPAVLDGLAKDLGLSRQQAARLLVEVFGPAGHPGKGKPGKGKPGKPGDTRPVLSAAALAELLGVPQAKAQAAIDAVLKLATGPKGSVDPSSPQFAAIAEKLGVSPQRLEDALVQLKKAAAGKPPAKSPGRAAASSNPTRA